MRVLLLSLFLLVPAAASSASEWEIQADECYIGFSIPHLSVVTVRGRIKDFAGHVHLDDRDVTRSSVQVKMAAKSIDTGNEKRDRHLFDVDFFDAFRYPHLTFASTKVEQVESGLKLTGVLTIKDVSREVVLMTTPPSKEVKNLAGKARVGVSARTTLKRQDFGLVWNRMIEGVPFVGDEVAVQIDAELVKQEPAQIARQR
jgi:polyisoprenoid-binding protein YceI